MNIVLRSITEQTIQMIIDLRNKYLLSSSLNGMVENYLKSMDINNIDLNEEEKKKCKNLYDEVEKILVNHKWDGEKQFNGEPNRIEISNEFSEFLQNRIFSKKESPKKVKAKSIMEKKQNNSRKTPKLKSYNEKKRISIKEEKYLRNILLTLLETPGNSGNEKIVLDFIIKELKLCKDLKIIRNKDFGVCIIVPPKKTPKQWILFDSHVDTVQIEYMKPKIRVEDVFGVEREMIKATGLDNRMHVACLLSMVKHLRYENTGYVAVFSVEEECGFVGASKFSKKFNLKDYGIDLKKIIVLDVTQGKLPNKKDESYLENRPTIGGGIIPVYQAFADYCYMRLCNVVGYNVGMYRKVPKCRYACGCLNMHSPLSYGSLSDLFDLYEFLVCDYEIIITNEKEVVEWSIKNYDPRYITVFIPEPTEKELEEEEKEFQNIVGEFSKIQLTDE